MLKKLENAVTNYQYRNAERFVELLEHRQISRSFLDGLLTPGVMILH